MNVLIIHAHPDPNSFNAAMKNAAVEALTAAGHQVQVSDLYAMGFKAIIGADDFPVRASTDRLQILREQRHAVEQGAIPRDVANELEKLFWADLIIFQFPLWWGSMPAILKGYVERVFMLGKIYGRGTDGLLGRKGMVAMTEGGPIPEAERPAAVEESIRRYLGEVHGNVFALAKLETVRPFIVFGPGHISPEERSAYLSQYQEYLLSVTN